MSSKLKELKDLSRQRKQVERDLANGIGDKDFNIKYLLYFYEKMGESMSMDEYIRLETL